MSERLKALSDAGVSIWLDDLSRERLETGNLADLVRDDHVVGVTTNPSIFASALAEGERYDEQDAAYRESVIPPTVKARVSVEAGVAQGWREVVGDHGRIISIEHYGASADYARIYQEFGITAEAVAAAATDSIRSATD